MRTLLKGEGVVKSFGGGAERRAVLDRVSIELREGEFVAVMGPSGSGKSTLLYALSGMDGIDSGRVTFEGRELAALGDDELSDLRRRRMGFVFQQPTLLGSLDLLDNIILPAARDDRRGAARHAEKARELMRRTGIEGLERRSVSQVSGGQLQRAGICRALMRDPAVLFGDEPTGALNSSAARGIMDIIEEVNSGGTAVLLVTHDARVAARAGRVVFMRDGGIESELELGRRDGEGLEPRADRVAEAMRDLGV
ncbi:MAG: ABC transporter ATP-binding protein [Spirochaetaceae bacterium]|nr:ABC transporter ATP-binding protein [Spirochaetaceae bacterium]